MKKMAFILSVFAMLANNGLYAQDSNMGKAPVAGQNNNKDVSWGVALGSLAVLATVVGITAASASSSPSTFSNSN